ncbi:hypothetical protein PoB_001274500 [Plakobranchus ocellatus]|uniref:Uncharacterized protein n=1 Tax=Plakobranchus ocellatus TaxID=259542 RepID=A0AAV3YSX8_9GAST|nr:hypothetical protein PoB_001274500 [Plakobranchus ocellatus]
MASPQQGDLRLSGPPSGQGAVGVARTRDRRAPAVPGDSLSTMPPTPLILKRPPLATEEDRCYEANLVIRFI